MADDDSKYADAHERRELEVADYMLANIGKEYWRSSVREMKDLEARRVLASYCERIVEVVQGGYGLMLDGATGVGKTWAATAILKQAIRHRFGGYFVTHSELRELQFNDREYGTGQEGVTLNYKLPNFRVLVIDGLDEPFLTDKVFGPLQLERLINHRNSRKFVTIVTSRVGAQIKEKCDSLFDRMSQTMQPIRIDGPNRRDDARKRLRDVVLGESGS